MCRQIPWSLAVLLTVTGCTVQREQMRPSLATRRDLWEGRAAVVYPLEIHGQRMAEAKVWSRGVSRATIHGTRRTVVHVGFELRNRSNRPIALDLDDGLWLEDVLTDRGQLPVVPPATNLARVIVPPGKTYQIDVRFPLPVEVAPDRVDAFRFRWTVEVQGRPYYGRATFQEWGPGTYAYGPDYPPAHYLDRL